MDPRRTTAVVLAFVAGMVAGCHSNVRSSPPPEPAPAERHVVRSAELRRIMQRLETLVYDRVQADLALDEQRMENADRLAKAAGDLAVAARAIPPAAATHALDDAARRRFDEYATTLAIEARTLQQLARERQFVGSAAQFERLGHACAGCHSLYRAQ